MHDHANLLVLLWLHIPVEQSSHTNPRHLTTQISQSSSSTYQYPHQQHLAPVLIAKLKQTLVDPGTPNQFQTDTWYAG